MRILLIGAAGQLGQDLLPMLAIRRHEVKALTHEELEICSAEAVRQQIANAQPQCVINTAAFHRVDECEDEAEKTFAVNVFGVRNLAQSAEEAGAALVHFSTDYVFGGEKRTPYKESDLPQPLSVYAISKLAGEFAARRYCSRHFVIRTCGLYGMGGSRSKGGNFVETMLRLAAQKKTIRVVADQVVTPTSTADLAARVLPLIESERYGLYHMTSAGQCSWYDFAAEVVRLAKVKAELHPTDSQSFGAKARRPAYSVLDNCQMRSAGIAEFRPWQEALAEYMRRRCGQ
ncbi:MAG TPA: dTDP-4-dehydrorhamnose reductase [Terriglobales bacterium]|jgi:dTDP-4-dehydrorhamnose reductase|nr:dTDP-4-dehydrorhamnose reductase [Terriglobales bacterium]